MNKQTNLHVKIINHNNFHSIDNSQHLTYSSNWHISVVCV